MSIAERLKVQQLLGYRVTFCPEPDDRWNLYEDGISATGLELFLEDKEQFRLAQVKGWRSKNTKPSLAFGDFGHCVLEKAYGSVSLPRDGDVQRWVAEVQKDKRKEMGRLTEFQSDALEKTAGLVEIVLQAYIKRWAGDWKGGTYPIKTIVATPAKWLSLEEWFEVPFDFGNGRPIKIVGKRDGVFETTRRTTWVQDHKFKSVIKEEDIALTLPYDTQQMLYLWVSWKQGLKPAGTVLNVIRRPGQHDTGNLKQFLDKVRKDVNPKRWDHYFLRFAMPVTKTEVEAWANRFLFPALSELRDWYEGKVWHYLRPGSLMNKYGRCDLFDLIVRDQERDYYRREKRNGPRGDNKKRSNKGSGEAAVETPAARPTPGRVRVAVRVRGTGR